MPRSYNVGTANSCSRPRKVSNHENDWYRWLTVEVCVGALQLRLTKQTVRCTYVIGLHTKQFCKVHLTCYKTVLYSAANKEPHSQHPTFSVTVTMCSCCLQHEHLLSLTYTFRNLYYTFIHVVSYTFFYISCCADKYMLNYVAVVWTHFTVNSAHTAHCTLLGELCRQISTPLTCCLPQDWCCSRSYSTVSPSAPECRCNPAKGKWFMRWHLTVVRRGGGETPGLTLGTCIGFRHAQHSSGLQCEPCLVRPVSYSRTCQFRLLITSGASWPINSHTHPRKLSHAPRHSSSSLSSSAAVLPKRGRERGNWWDCMQEEEAVSTIGTTGLIRQVPLLSMTRLAHIHTRQTPTRACPHIHSHIV